MSKYKLNGQNIEKRESWHRHPLLVTGLSIAMGTYGLYFLQTSKIKKDAAISQRLVIAEEVSDYASESIRILNKIQFILKGREWIVSDATYERLVVQTQELIEKNYGNNSKVQMHLVIFFKSKEPFKKFLSLQDYAAEALSYGLAMLKERKPVKIDTVEAKLNEYYIGIRILGSITVWSMKEDGIPIPDNIGPNINDLPINAKKYIN